MSEAMPLQPEQSFAQGRFVLIKRLGRGGMGEVWLARDERLKEPVALKFLPPEIRGDAAALDDLRRETARSHKLSHPNIVRIHDLHEDADGTAFIVMEYIDGPTLAALRLEQPARVLAWDYLRPLVAQLCAALDYAHGEKVIHRDLKPANIMVDSRGRLKLADFGIAAVASDSMSRVSVKHSTSGTLPYMSPQQVTGKRPQATDDLYALGATLYELLTGKPPFHSGDITHQVLHEPPEPMDERLAAAGMQNDVPPDAASLIMACLAKEPGQRPQSARLVAEWIGLELAAKPTQESLAAAFFPQGPSGSEAVGSETAGEERSKPTGDGGPPIAPGILKAGKGGARPARLGRSLAAVGIVLMVMAGTFWLRIGTHRTPVAANAPHNSEPASELNQPLVGAPPEAGVSPPDSISKEVRRPEESMANAGSQSPIARLDNVNLGRDSSPGAFQLPRPSLAGLPSGRVVIWGRGNGGSPAISKLPKGMAQVVAISGGGFHSLALTREGKVWAWGLGTVNTGKNQNFGQSMVPPGLDHVVAIAAGWDHSLALRQDGTVVAWGHNAGGDTDPPADLTNAVAIAAGAGYSVALTRDGLVRAWGVNGQGQLNIPPNLNHVVGIAAGFGKILALRSDGTVAAWGADKSDHAVVPAGLSNVIAIAGESEHCVALKTDGRVVVWGGDPNMRWVPPLSGVVAIAANGHHTLAIQRDGTVIEWGSNNVGQTKVPTGLNHVIAIACGSGHSLALTTSP